MFDPPPDYSNDDDLSNDDDRYDQRTTATTTTTTIHINDDANTNPNTNTNTNVNTPRSTTYTYLPSTSPPQTTNHRLTLLTLRRRILPFVSTHLVPLPSLLLIKSPFLLLSILLPLLSHPSLLFSSPLAILPTLMLTFPRLSNGVDCDYAGIDIFTLPFYTYFQSNSTHPHLSFCLSLLGAAAMIGISRVKRMKVMRVTQSLPYPLICGILSR